MRNRVKIAAKVAASQLFGYKKAGIQIRTQKIEKFEKGLRNPLLTNK